MMRNKFKAKIRREFKTAQLLLQQFLGIPFQPPKLYMGEKHRKYFIKIRSLNDFTYASGILGVYDDEINGMFLPNSLTIEEGNSAKRIFVFIHECGHAFSAQQNPQFKQANITRLITNKTKRAREKGYIYRVFDEGLATYLSIQICLQSGRADLIEKAEKEHEELLDFFKEWTSPNSRDLALMAKIYKLDPNNWQKVREQYLKNNEGGLEYYQYDLGYYFMRTLQPDVSRILRMIQQPPKIIQHIIYPETYISVFAKD